MPSDPAQERGDAGDREASLRTGPRPDGESGGGEHAGYDSRHVRYRYALHRQSSSGTPKSLTGSRYPRYTRTSTTRTCTKDPVVLQEIAKIVQEMLSHATIVQTMDT